MGMDNKKIADLKKTIGFIEELSWLLESRKNLDLRGTTNILKSFLNERNIRSDFAQSYTSSNPNIHFLIGVLPRLFQDKKLFPSNATIAKFAKDVLNVPIPRFEKRSKYEKHDAWR